MSLRLISIHSRRGLTLVELLMVISIMVILMVVAIPMIRPAFQDRNIREASRQVNAFLSGAKARAAETGRPMGVWIERRQGFNNHGVQLFMAEVPPNFTGALQDTRVTVDSNFVIDFSVSDLGILKTLIENGDAFSIRFDHKGPSYIGRRSDSTFRIWVQPPRTHDPPGQTFEVTLPPTRSVVAPLTLPADAVVDLSWSGIGASGTEFEKYDAEVRPVIITFSPSGRVDYVYCNTPTFTSFRPNGSVHLLVGRRSKTVDLITNLEMSNLADPTNLWVTINVQTGSIVTSDNAFTTATTGRVKEAREFARTSVQKGGR